MCSAPYNEFYVLNICCSDFILSKQWKDLWKRLTILTLFHHEFVKAASFNKFASEVLSARDASISLLNNPRNSHLKLRNTFQHKIVLSTPNLSSLTIIDHYGVSHEPLSSPSNLSCLEEGTIDTDTNISYSVFIGWLQVFTNVKILTLSSDTLRLLKELSNLPTMRTQPPRFVRLETLKVKMIPYVEISYEELKRAVEYLLQNSQLIRVVVIKC
ncbi:hypothetical protein GLYMA_10G136200v4 [Glycine max]|uniref:FBD domain-containing protein n=2 Tax=Glycine subgen. Soja TaxID=1462606 RepID=A0A0R0HSX8_SOYBN|nr:hypothetical protein GYH30_027914 [Glycine max]KRH33617.1 hypothetical protein GLYMA_10G136200v4 [Glycine max]RZB87093.1 hypothetical protein D0Y65_026989 [Glycine soja]